MKISDTLFVTADLLEERGMTSLQLIDGEDRLCLIGGFNTVVTGTHSHPGSSKYSAHIFNVNNFIREQQQMDSWPTTWSNKTSQ